MGTARKAPTLNEAGERIVETVMLARKFPERRLPSAAAMQAFSIPPTPRRRARRACSPTWAWRQTG